MKNKNRLIYRMILGFGLTITVASAIGGVHLRDKSIKIQDDSELALNSKEVYLDTFEQSDEFKTTYNTDVTTLNNRLIAREISGEQYDSELEFLNSNEYTEQVFVANASEQAKAEFDEINQNITNVNNEWDNHTTNCAYSVIGLLSGPTIAIGAYQLDRNLKHLSKHQNNPKTATNMPNIKPEIMQKAMEIDVPPYHPINAEETKTRVEIVYDEKLKVIRAIEVQDTENQTQNNEANQNTL